MDVDFEADTQNISAGETVSFTDLSVGEASKWNWTFEGGTPPTSVLQNPEVTYENPGTYGVTLEVSNADNSEVLEKEGFIVVSAPDVTAAFEASKTNAIAGENVVFTDLSTGSPDSWNWEFISSAGTTVTSTEQNPVIAFDEAGIYSVKLTASNKDNSDEIVMADYVTVVDETAVEADFVAEQRNTYSGATIAFTDTSVGTATEWNWTFEGGTPSTSTEQNPEVTYDSPGTYKVTLMASNDSESSTEVKEEYITVVPGAELVAFYPFGGNEIDAGPNNFVPTIFGNVSFSGTDRDSNEDGAAVFDGASGLVVPDNDAYNFETSDFSIGVWVKTDDTSKMMVWQESGANGPGDNQAWLRIGDNSSDRLLRFATEDSGGGAILNVGEAETGGVSDGEWHYVVTVREGSTTRMYIDGDLVKEMDKSAIKDVSNEQDFKIAMQEGEDGYHTFFTGQLDDMVIYNKALTSEEVAELYNL